MHTTLGFDCLSLANAYYLSQLINIFAYYIYSLREWSAALRPHYGGHWSGLPISTPTTEVTGMVWWAALTAEVTVVHPNATETVATCIGAQGCASPTRPNGHQRPAFARSRYTAALPSSFNIMIRH